MSPYKEVHASPYANDLDLDVLVVGAGFAGVYLLHYLRKKGYSVKIFDAANDLGGTWRHNRYPGARVDSPIPVYELSIPEVWKTWTWTELFPGWKEIQAYFDHAEKVLDIKKDVAFNTVVTEAHFDQVEGKWHVKTADGRLTKAKYFLPCIGFAAKRYVPDFPGIETFKGKIHHSAEWPEKDIDVTDKRCAVIGTGASGVQIIQEWSKKAKSLVVFQRTPILALPMNQRKLTSDEQDRFKHTYPDNFIRREAHYGGFPYDSLEKMTFDDDVEEREQVYESLWAKGGFAFWIGGYKDMLYDLKANREAYNFWAKKTRARIQDSRKRDLLAPLEPPHPFGTKRPSLEQDYFEMYNKPNVDVVSVRQNPIVEVRPEGIVTSDGVLHEIDYLALATGFDAVTGSLLKIDLTDIHGKRLPEKWSDGTKTYLGISISGFPNMFFCYGPQAPTAFSNGPTLVEIQAKWIMKVIDFCEKNGIKSLDATEEAQENWVHQIHEIADKSLFPLADSWYMGANIPGKKREMLNYTGGVPSYTAILNSTFKKGMEGYTLVKKASTIQGEVGPHDSNTSTESAILTERLPA